MTQADHQPCRQGTQLTVAERSHQAALNTAAKDSGSLIVNGRSRSNPRSRIDSTDAFDRGQLADTHFLPFNDRDSRTAGGHLADSQKSGRFSDIWRKSGNGRYFYYVPAVSYDSCESRCFAASGSGTSVLTASGTNTEGHSTTHG